MLISTTSGNAHDHMNFDQIAEFADIAKEVVM